MIGFNLQLLLVSVVCLDGSCECLVVDVFLYILRMKRSAVFDVLHKAHHDVYLWGLILQLESDSKKKTYFVHTARKQGTGDIKHSKCYYMMKH